MRKGELCYPELDGSGMAFKNVLDTQKQNQSGDQIRPLAKFSLIPISLTEEGCYIIYSVQMEYYSDGIERSLAKDSPNV